MAGAKEITVKPIGAADASRIVKACHYSGKVVQNSQVHFGVFMGGKCGGAMQFGPSLDKRKIVGLVRGTLWNEFLELNRMAFADWLPRNSESRAIAVAMRLLRKAYPWLKWIVSFADAAQCGDGTIYRASGFVLTGLRKNTSLWAAPDGHVSDDVTITAGPPAKRIFSRTSLTDNRSKQQQQQAMAVVSRTTATKGHHTAAAGGGASMRAYKEAGFAPIPGFQLRYLYFLKPEERANLTVPILPFSEIARRGAGMYKGRPRPSSEATGHQPGEGGAEPTRTLQSSEATLERPV